MSAITYNNLSLEDRTYQENGETKLLPYDQSLARLRQAGFTRHLYPVEAFQFIIDGLEMKLAPHQHLFCAQMLTSPAEWLNIAIGVEEKKHFLWHPSRTLTLYFDPEGLVWDPKKRQYNTQKFTYSRKQDFDITSLPVAQYVDLSHFSDSFALAVTGRSCASLPKNLRDKNDSRRVQVYIPRVGTLCPAARVGYKRYVVRLGILYGSDGASRGAKTL
ncbi:hypothetical protein HZC31_03950 [Candidatus Woesearchaeota archaeon]|nr:hypothetical protein [Candidatus Woesearchaeota archaeon]